MSPLTSPSRSPLGAFPTAFSTARLPRGLYAICDDGVRPELSLVRQAEALLSGGVRVLQVRAKNTPLRALIEQCKAIAAVCGAHGALCLVNDRVDVARVSGAHGVHLGDEDLLPEDARQILGASALIGVTVRTGAAARLAQQQGADYAGVGPIFATRTKAVPVEPIGLAGLTRIVGESPLPLVAIAGIGLSNLAEVAGTGVHSAAVVSDLLLAPDIAAQARALQKAFERGCES